MENFHVENRAECCMLHVMTLIISCATNDHSTLNYNVFFMDNKISITVACKRTSNELLTNI